MELARFSYRLANPVPFSYRSKNDFFSILPCQGQKLPDSMIKIMVNFSSLWPQLSVKYLPHRKPNPVNILRVVHAGNNGVVYYPCHYCMSMKETIRKSCSEGLNADASTSSLFYFLTSVTLYFHKTAKKMLLSAYEHPKTQSSL